MVASVIKFITRHFNHITDCIYRLPVIISYYFPISSSHGNCFMLTLINENDKIRNLLEPLLKASCSVCMFSCIVTITDASLAYSTVG